MSRIGPVGIRRADRCGRQQPAISRCNDHLLELHIRSISRRMKGLALRHLIERHVLVRLVRLLDEAGPADYRRDAGALELRSLGAERHLAEIAVRKLVRQRHDLAAAVSSIGISASCSMTIPAGREPRASRARACLHERLHLVEQRVGSISRQVTELEVEQAVVNDVERRAAPNHAGVHGVYATSKLRSSRPLSRWRRAMPLRKATTSAAYSRRSRPAARWAE